MKRGSNNGLLAVIVLLGGGFVAMQFQRDAAHGSASPTQPAPNSPLQWRVDADSSQLSATPLAALETSPSRASAETIRAEPARVPIDDDRLPEIDVRYGGLLNKFGGQRGPAPLPAARPTVQDTASRRVDSLSIPAKSGETTAAAPAAHAMAEPGETPAKTAASVADPGEAAATTVPTRLAARPWTPQPPPERDKDPTPSRTHRIRDGDTLDLLAERYYGDRGLAVEIFQWNRAVMNRPDLLPVGKTIELPPQSALRRNDPLAGNTVVLLPAVPGPAVRQVPRRGPASRPDHGPRSYRCNDPQLSSSACLAAAAAASSAARERR
jgi:nucleoid-associated protein YgaU